MSPYLIRTIGLLGILALSSCVGYQLGGAKPSALASVKRLHVPLAKNLTQIPRAGAYATNQVVDAVVRDGTYRLSSQEQADAVLYVDFFEVSYSAIRTAEENRLRSEELEMVVTLKWKVVDAQDVLKTLDSGTSVGRTSGFVDANFQTAQQAIIDDALERASVSLVGRIADGF